VRLSAGTIPPPVITALAWRYKDAAKDQAHDGLIPWAAYRQYCTEVDRIKRDRLRTAESAAHVPSSRGNMRLGNQYAATAALMRSRHTGDERETHIDRAKAHCRVSRRLAVATALHDAPELSDRELARRVGVDHKTVAAARSRLQKSGEIPHFLKRVDPRTGNLSQPSSNRRLVRWRGTAVKAV